jgi:hypothetical protein
MEPPRSLCFPSPRMLCPAGRFGAACRAAAVIFIDPGAGPGSRRYLTELPRSRQRARGEDVAKKKGSHAFGRPSPEKLRRSTKRRSSAAELVAQADASDVVAAAMRPGCAAWAIAAICRVEIKRVRHRPDIDMQIFGPQDGLNSGVYRCRGGFSSRLAATVHDPPCWRGIHVLLFRCRKDGDGRDEARP